MEISAEKDNDACFYDIIDKNTGEKIEHVVYADDENNIIKRFLISSKDKIKSEDIIPNKLTPSLIRHGWKKIEGSDNYIRCRIESYTELDIVKEERDIKIIDTRKEIKVVEKEEN